MIQAQHAKARATGHHNMQRFDRRRHTLLVRQQALPILRIISLEKDRPPGEDASRDKTIAESHPPAKIGSQWPMRRQARNADSCWFETSCRRNRSAISGAPDII